jgi:hypothetical protein
MAEYAAERDHLVAEVDDLVMFHLDALPGLVECRPDAAIARVSTLEPDHVREQRATPVAYEGLVLEVEREKEQIEVPSVGGRIAAADVPREPNTPQARARREPRSQRERQADKPWEPHEDLFDQGSTTVLPRHGDRGRHATHAIDGSHGGREAPASGAKEKRAG